MTNERPSYPQSWRSRCGFMKFPQGWLPLPFAQGWHHSWAPSFSLRAWAKDSQEDPARSCHYAWHGASAAASATVGLPCLLSSRHTSCPESHWLAHVLAPWLAHDALTPSIHFHTTLPATKPATQRGTRRGVSITYLDGGGLPLNTSVTLFDVRSCSAPSLGNWKRL